ncbi:UNVERIFIED_CONTAM: hypothetical protein HDU68_011915 [Siphonaria sp. JEL0065]|nr:hypothetical protein HDU68_011915 [Siphonaria sp. JEL0065]
MPVIYGSSGFSSIERRGSSPINAQLIFIAVFSSLIFGSLCYAAWGFINDCAENRKKAAAKQKAAAAATIGTHQQRTLAATP